MKLKEFQCWLDGYRDGKDETPTDSEWRRIRKKLDSEVKDSESHAPIDLSSVQSSIYQP